MLLARWVLTMAPAAQVLTDHAVVIHQGRILDVLPRQQALARYQAAQTKQLDEHALMPGLVNLHGHAAMTLLRGAGDDLPLMTWLQTRIWPAEAALVSPEFVYDGSLLAGYEMLLGGTTCCNDMYFFPDQAAAAFSHLGMRATLGMILIEFPSAYASDAADYLRKGLATRDAWRDDPLIRFSIAPHAPYTVSDQRFAEAATLAEQLDIPIHVHLHETATEVHDSLRDHGVRPIQRLHRLGVINERTIAVHAVHLSDDDIALMAKAGVHVAHCPASNLKLASGFAPIQRLIQAGVNLGIGTDGAASNNRLDMIEETRLAALLAKGVSMDASALTASQALHAATMGGATALGLGDQIGSLEVGKQADVIAIRLSDVDLQPLFDPISQIVYCGNRRDVTDVWIRGIPVVDQRQLANPVARASVDAMTSRLPLWQNRTETIVSGAVRL